MKFLSLFPLSLIILIFIFVEFFAFVAIFRITRNAKSFLKITIRYAYWLIPIYLISTIIYFISNPNYTHQPDKSDLVSFSMGFFVLFYVPKIILAFFQALQLIYDIFKKLFIMPVRKRKNNKAGSRVISRSQFISEIGVVMAAVPFLSIFYGITHGRFNFIVRRVKIPINNLPAELNGLRIVQISDYHIGSFKNYPDEVKKSVDLINQYNPDLVVFTGDFVNSVASELEPFVETLSKINSKYGKFSILGNHDYGNYFRWENDEAKQANLLQLIEYQKNAGFTMLLNQSKIINVKNEKFALIGIENWGNKPFPQHGDYEAAVHKVENIPIKILLSHDPTFWDEKILGKKDVQLTLSGHTHGMQFGIEMPGFKWSPVQWKYPRWAGLYSEGNQYLYVNRGIGYIGFPGRVGILPEIALIELNNNVTS